MSTKFAEAAFTFESAQSDFEETLIELGCGEFSRIIWDSYDCSVELVGVSPGYVINNEALTYIFDQGFQRMWLNYTDGSEVYCHKGGKPVLHKQAGGRPKT